VQGAFIARGSMGNPWIFRRADSAPSIEELVAVVRHQAQLSLALKGPHGLIELRKHLGWYCKGFAGASDIRRRATSVETMDDVEALLAAVLDAAGAGTPIAA
jgi:tRNA-dihydrouridine synthase